MSARILVVDDDTALAEMIGIVLRTEGFEPSFCADGAEALEAFRTVRPGLILLDLMLPGLDGLRLVARLRDCENMTPVLILSALGEVDDRVAGLRVGGDDYLPKPYAFSELLARIETLARRKTGITSDIRLQVGDLTLDRLTRQVARGETKIVLQPREFRLLEFLMRHAGQLVTRTMLLEGVWDYHFDPQTNVIDVHISRLRSKIDKDFDTPLLHTERGAGYILRATD